LRSSRTAYRPRSTGQAGDHDEYQHVEILVDGVPPAQPLSELGRREEALAPTEEAVTIRRRLAEAQPAAYLPDLAGSLNNLGILLSGLGRREEALAPTEEAAALYRRLAEAQPAAYLPDLAGSLNNLGILLSGLGRREEALAATDEAVEIRRRLDQSIRPDTHQ
jgi:tetratricopeptide (TPR) repeat protein